jgi:hypothetical protein
MNEGPYRDEIYTVEIRRDTRTGVAVGETWMRDGQIHREDGPAMIERDSDTGNVIRESWIRHDQHHREGGPAVISRKADTGRIYRSRWYLNGKNVKPPRTPRRPLQGRNTASPSAPQH